MPFLPPNQQRQSTELLTVGQKFTRPACRVTEAAIDRYLLLVRARTQQHCSKPASRSGCCRLMGQTDGRTDTRPFYDAYRILCGLHDN